MSCPKPFELTNRGLVLTIRLTPNGATDAVGECTTLADGMVVLKIRVRAVPEDNKANKAAIKLLAKILSWPRTDMSLVGGHKSRIKKILIEGNSEEIANKISAIL
ncbi:MAG: DUF167 family protein [Fimbriimonadaceae bacterium]|nr:DUF167 family protein [Alphaproteobacteria bacterium]